jgi:hypothetical protein
MNGNVVLAIGIILLIGALIGAVIKEKSVKSSVTGKGWSRAYLLFLIFALAAAGLEFFPSIYLRFSVDAYSVLFDLCTLGLLGAFLSGLILVIRRRGFVVSYVLFLCGAFTVFGEFLGT